MSIREIISIANEEKNELYKNNKNGISLVFNRLIVLNQMELNLFKNNQLSINRSIYLII